MDRTNLDRAGKLLAKAQGTEFEDEAAALVEKAYVLLAEFLNGLEDPQGLGTPGGVARRRERRLLRDRRTARRLFGRRTAAAGGNPEASYRQDGRDADGPGRDIDLRA